MENRGQTLIETLVAVSTLTIGFLGIVTLLSQSIGLNRVATDNYTATYLAAEGVEVVKNILDGNLNKGRPWLQGISDNAEVEYDSSSLGKAYSIQDKLWYNPDTKLFSYIPIGAPTGFARQIRIDASNSGEVKVNSIVTWISRGGISSKINIEDHFFDSRNPSP